MKPLPQMPLKHTLLKGKVEKEARSKVRDTGILTFNFLFSTGFERAIACERRPEHAHAGIAQRRIVRAHQLRSEGQMETE